MLWSLNLLLLLGFHRTNCHLEPRNGRRGPTLGPDHDSRRILKGVEIIDTRPYMVYLRPIESTKDTTRNPDAYWLCGGVILHERYILTSAACIEDVEHFHIISGTHKWLPPGETSECVTNGALRAVWKCVPKTYRYDGYYFNNIRWMANDIAVVMTDQPFNFKKRVKGCDFIPQMVRYNNYSAELEESGTSGSIAGWGSTNVYADADEIIARTNVNSPVLMETDVLIIPKSTCKNRWQSRYEEIIEQYMICGKSIHLDELSEGCEDNQLECRQLVFSEEDGGSVRRNRESKTSDRKLLQSLAKAKKMQKARRKSLRREGKELGGFCENDHGGPLVVGQGRQSTVIGIISAYKTMNDSKRCVGPFLYTSVYKNRHLINCAIYKQRGTQCTAVLRTSSTVLDVETIDWPDTHRKWSSSIGENGGTTLCMSISDQELDTVSCNCSSQSLATVLTILERSLSYTFKRAILATENYEKEYLHTSQQHKFIELYKDSRDEEIQIPISRINGKCLTFIN